MRMEFQTKIRLTEFTGYFRAPIVRRFTSKDAHFSIFQLNRALCFKHMTIIIMNMKYLYLIFYKLQKSIAWSYKFELPLISDWLIFCLFSVSHSFKYWDKKVTNSDSLNNSDGLCQMKLSSPKCSLQWKQQTNYIFHKKAKNVIRE